MADEDDPDHWFEAVADHLGAGLPALLVHQGDRAGGRLPRRRARPRAGHAGARRRLRPGPPRHELARRGIEVARRRHQRAVRRAGRRGAPTATACDRSSGSTPARWPFDGEFDAAISLCQGALRARSAGRRRRDLEPCSAGMAASRALRAGRAVRACRRVHRLLPGAATSRSTTRSTPPPGSTTSAPRSRTRRATAAEVDLWTTCYTPRELRLLAERGGPRRRRTSGRSTPATTTPTRPTIEHARVPRWSPAVPDGQRDRN